MTAAEIADAYVISKDHLVKVIQQLARLGYVRAYPGRSGGVALAQDPSKILVRDVIESMEGATGLLECIQDPDSCPMEPGCTLRKLLMKAELAFYETLGATTISDLFQGRRKGGVVNLHMLS